MDLEGISSNVVFIIHKVQLKTIGTNDKEVLRESSKNKVLIDVAFVVDEEHENV